jgi:hypothetical protein
LFDQLNPQQQLRVMQLATLRGTLPVPFTIVIAKAYLEANTQEGVVQELLAPGGFVKALDWWAARKHDWL